MAKMRGGDIVAELLARLGVRYVAGIPGHTVLDFVDGLYSRQDRIKAFFPRNEETAAFMADAYYRIAGVPMAIFGHISVGSANLLTGVLNANLESSAVIVITGETWTKFQGRGAYQELARDRDAGTPDMFRGSVKRSWQVNTTEKLPEVILKAFKLATTGRPGPVHIDITQEAFADQADVELPDDVSLFQIPPRQRADAAATQHAIDLLLKAERPAILAGGGVMLSRAGSEILALARALQAPIATTVMGKGTVPEDDPLCFGISGWVGTLPANEALRTCDVLLAVGTRFSETDTSAWIPGKTFNIPPTKLIHVDVDAAEIGKYYPTSVALLGDAKAVATELLSGIKAGNGQPRRRDAWFATLQEARRRWSAEIGVMLTSDATPINPARIVRELDKLMPQDGILIGDVGNNHKWIAQLFPATGTRRILSSMGGAAMGFGACGAPGAALAAPGKRIVCWTGDGGMAMSLQVLTTMAEYKLPITIVIVNDNANGAIKRPQDARFGTGRNLFSLYQRRNGSTFQLRFAEVAKAIGIGAEDVRRPEDLAGALERSLDADGPYLLDVHTELETYVPMTGGGAFVLPAAVK